MFPDGGPKKKNPHPPPNDVCKGAFREGGGAAGGEGIGLRDPKRRSTAALKGGARLMWKVCNQGKGGLTQFFTGGPI